MTTFPTPQPDQGATSPPDLDPSATASGNDDSGDLRAALGRVIAEGDYSLGAMWSVPGIGDAERIAEVVLKAGYRLVSEDEATVDRVARALADVDEWGRPDGVPLSQVYDYTRLARAAVRALREGGAS